MRSGEQSPTFLKLETFNHACILELLLTYIPRDCTPGIETFNCTLSLELPFTMMGPCTSVVNHTHLDERFVPTTIWFRGEQ